MVARYIVTVLLAAATFGAGPVIHRRAAFQAGAGAWADANYAKRISVTIDNTQVGSTLTNFPLYVRLSDLPASFFSTVQADGDDVRAYKDDHATQMAIEMVTIDTGGNTGEVHVCVPSVSSSVDTVIYLYYGYGSATAYATPEDVWDATGANYMAVWHMQAVANTAQPSATGIAAIDADPVNLESGDSIAGKLGNCVTFDGVNENYTVPSTDASTYLRPDSTGTLEAWINTDDFDYQTFIHYGDSTSKGIGLWLNGSNYRPVIGDNTSNVYNNLLESVTGKSADTWYHLGVTWDGANAKLYFNGAEVDTYAFTSSITWFNTDFRIGKWSAYTDGELDEIRLHDSAMSADWMSVQYTNHNSPTTLYTIGSEESQ